jgi:Gluconate 2-dehydrogenase subunit 3
MKRRIALKQLGLMTAGAMLIPSCVKQITQASIPLKNIVVNGDQEALLAEIAETIIPATDIPGAKALNAHRFILRMVDDCQDKESQQQFVTGLSQVDAAIKQKFNKSFEECSTDERKKFLLDLEEKNKKAEDNDKKEDLPAFYSLTKRYSVQAFLGSEYVMTNVLVYNMIPGKFQGCVEIKDKNDIQTVIG